MSDSRYFVAKGKHLVVPVTKQEYDDYWDKKRKEPITNDGWFCNLSMKEKAKALHKLYLEMQNHFGCHPDEEDCVEEYCLYWLKAVHRDD